MNVNVLESTYWGLPIYGNYYVISIAILALNELPTPRGPKIQEFSKP